MNKYGRFSEDKKEFIITRPDTPAPWINYISNGRYTGLISHTGGGFSFYQSPRDSRITRWRYNGLPMDRPGRYIYFRDKSDGKYWSPTWQPTATDLSDFECRHGLNYTKISSAYRDLKHSVLYFVPDDDLEIWKISIKNNSDIKRRLDVFAFVELALGHALIDLINQPNDQHFNDVFFDRNDQILYASKRYWVPAAAASVEQANQEWDKFVYFASSLPVAGWDGSKNSFIGRWRSESNPVAVEHGRCNNSEITAGDAVGALQLELSLEPGEQKDFVIILGVAPKEQYKTDAAILVKKYRAMSTVNTEFEKVKAEWHEYIDAVNVETPDENMNTMLNVWNQYQTSVTFRFSRDASYYHGGLLFGRGYRDSCQDIMGPVMTRPDWVKQRIEEMSLYQFSDGSTFHLYHPFSGSGERTGHSDTPLWLPLAIMVYLKETGDFDFLNLIFPFFDKDKGSILEHLFKAIDYVIENLTDRYLAKIGPGDWNDTLDYLGRAGKGESIWVTMFLAYMLKETVVLCRHINLTEKADHYENEYNKVKSAINEHAWDGQWYIRATNDLGEVIGSSKNEQGRIFLNTQSWAVISGVADNNRAEQCMQSAAEHLDTPKGPKILHPAYTKIDKNVGLATRCVPGKKENGAVFNHPVSWAILAECLMGNGDRAFDIYQKALPMNPVIDIDRYEVEPYVYAEYVTSPDHPTFGQASHSWLTGSSTWMLRNGIDYILGVRPEYKGLRIDPCIPKDWKQFTVKRKYRGKIYKVKIENPEKRNSGVQSILINNKRIEGNLINLADPEIRSLIDDSNEIQVRAVLV